MKSGLTVHPQNNTLPGQLRNKRQKVKKRNAEYQL